MRDYESESNPQKERTPSNNSRKSKCTFENPTKGEGDGNTTAST